MTDLTEIFITDNGISQNVDGVLTEFGMYSNRPFNDNRGTSYTLTSIMDTRIAELEAELKIQDDANEILTRRNGELEDENRKLKLAAKIYKHSLEETKAEVDRLRVELLEALEKIHGDKP